MSALDLLKAARVGAFQADAEAAAETARVGAFLADAEAARQSLSGLADAVAEREADALLAGTAAPDTPYAETRQRDKLERSARAADVAARKVAAALAGPIAERQREAHAALVDAALAASRVLRDEARADFLKGADALVEALAGMIAAHGFRDRLAGDTFDFDSAIHPPAELWDSATVARKFVQSLPPRLRPEGFSDRVEKAATGRLDALLADLEPAS